MVLFLIFDVIDLQSAEKVNSGVATTVVIRFAFLSTFKTLGYLICKNRIRMLFSYKCMGKMS